MKAVKSASMAKRYVKVSFVTWLSTFLYIVMQLISVPICLHYWGGQTYGSWLSLFAAFTIMRTVDGGHSTFIGNKLNVLYHQNRSEVSNTLASAVWGCIILGGLQLVILLILYLSNTLGLILDTNGGGLVGSEAFLAFMVLSVSWIFTGSYLGIVHRLQNPAGMMYQAAWWSMAFQMAQFGALIIAAMSHLNLLQTSILFAVIQAVVYVTSGIYIRYKLPEFYPWVRGCRLRIGVANLVKCLPVTSGGVLQQGSNSAVIMLISVIMGPLAVTIFSTLRTLSNLWNTLINVLTSPLIPDLVKFFVNKDWKRFLVVISVHTTLINSLINLTVLIAFPVLELVYVTWTGHKIKFNVSLLSYLLATVSVFSVTSLINSFLSGVNHSGFVVVSSALRGIIALLLGAFLLRYMGIQGIGMALFIGEVIVFNVTLFMFFKPTLESYGCTGYRFFSSKWWLSPSAVIIFLLISSFGVAFLFVYYVIALILVLYGIIASWRSLDAEVKLKISSLLRIKKIS